MKNQRGKIKTKITKKQKGKRTDKSGQVQSQEEEESDGRKSQIQKIKNYKKIVKWKS